MLYWLTIRFKVFDVGVILTTPVALVDRNVPVFRIAVVVHKQVSVLESLVDWAQTAVRAVAATKHSFKGAEAELNSAVSRVLIFEALKPFYLSFDLLLSFHFF